MAVRIRMKKLGRLHRPFYRICAMDARRPRDGRVIEELGIYDPLVPETDLRCRLNGERVDYWLGVGAQPTEKVAVLIKKYGARGSHVEKQQQLLAAEEAKRAAQAAASPAAMAATPIRKKRTAKEVAAPEAATTE